MQRYFCGIDFGTSNSVVSLISPGENRQFIISEPSVIFFPQRAFTATASLTTPPLKYLIGSEAIEQYFDLRERGRLIHSIKSLLPDPHLQATYIYDKTVTMIDLMHYIFSHLKSRMDELIDARVDSIMVGRPVTVAHRKFNESIARKRIETAAQKAGFKHVEFQLEPVAAAFKYATSLDRAEIVLVADLGAGTSDFTIMKLNGLHNPEKFKEADILVTAGVHSGGDDFDSTIMWHRVVESFGKGTRYESMGKSLEVPVHLFHTLCHKEQVGLLKKNAYRDDLIYLLRRCESNPGLERLLHLVDNDLIFKLYRAVENAKVNLSDEDEISILFREGEIDLDIPLTFSAFNSFIAHHLEKIDLLISDMLKSAGVSEQQIGTVFLTGGSSLVRSVKHLFRKRFPESRINQEDPFISVSLGLALYQQLFSS